MTRFNLVLLLVLLGCGLGVVGAQHKARKLYIELQKQQELAQQLDVEWGQLQLEQSTWAVHARIDRVAAGRLEMAPPSSSRIQVVPQGAKGQP